MSRTWERSPDPIPRLRLPPRIWAVLHTEGILPLEQLGAEADQIHCLPRTGRKGVQIGQEEFARSEFPIKTHDSKADKAYPAQGVSRDDEGE
jgi:hypothetical protein